MNATVLKYERTKGYGFLAPADENLGDIFFHISSLTGMKRIKEGMEVEFDLGQSKGRDVALNIRPASVLPAGVSDERN